jgi:hypothetical protein
MKTTRSLFLLSALLPLACGPISESEDPLVDEQGLAQARQALLTLDSSALTDLPASGLPAQRLKRETFDVANIRRGLVQSDETFQVRTQLGSRAEHDAVSWKFEVDATRGQVLVLKKTPTGPASKQDPVGLERKAAARLNAWGIPAAELGKGHQQRVMQQDMERGRSPDAPRIQSHKAFFFRTLNGVRVEGHRAVVSHAPDGTFYRALIKWPALASSGHRLNTPLSRTEVESRARALLEREGITAGLARLQWQYTPTELSGGEVTLTLEALVRVSSEALGEPRLYEVDVDAVP